MLDEICAELRNWFIRQDSDMHFGSFSIVGGDIIPLTFLQDGQFFRIVGSAFNDGVYQYPCGGLTDEEFDGAIWVMNPPVEFLMLCEEITAYKDTDASKPSPFTSESFGGYTYSTSAKDRAWQTVFSKKLNRWRKL